MAAQSGRKLVRFLRIEGEKRHSIKFIKVLLCARQCSRSPHPKAEVEIRWWQQIQILKIRAVENKANWYT